MTTIQHTPYLPSHAMQNFMTQNHLCGAGMSYDQIQHADELGMVNSHSGGLLMLSGEIDAGLVKMHDSWGPEYQVVVHTYDPDADGFEADPVENETYYDNPKEAAEAFFALLGLAMDDE